MRTVRGTENRELKSPSSLSLSPFLHAFRFFHDISVPAVFIYFAHCLYIPVLFALRFQLLSRADARLPQEANFGA